MPPRRAVELRVGGQTYRVVATEDDRHVQHLAELVDRKHLDVVPQGRGVTVQQGMLLTALALADEVEELRARAARMEAERDRALRLAGRARDVVGRVLSRVDGALSPLPPSVAAGAGEAARGGSAGAAPRPGPAAWVDEHGGHAADGSGDSDPLTDPPDAIHEPVLIDLLPSKSRDVRQSLPGDVRQSLPGDVRQSLPGDQPGGDAGVPRTPRGGLRLVRQSSSPDDNSR